MVNSKIILGIAIAIAAIGIITIITTSQEYTGISESEKQQSTQSSVSVTDSADVAQNNPEFTIDKEGNKKYTISASDSPDLGD